MEIRYKRPDSKNALSILNSVKIDMEFTLSLKLDKKSSSTIVRNIYECFRMLGDAILISKGIESTDHIRPIVELTNLKVKTSRPINVINNIRVLRHNINYYGYSPTIIEARDVISIANSCFKPLLSEVSKIIESTEKT